MYIGLPSYNSVMWIDRVLATRPTHLKWDGNYPISSGMGPNIHLTVIAIVAVVSKSAYFFLVSGQQCAESAFMFPFFSFSYQEQSLYKRSYITCDN